MLDPAIAAVNEVMAKIKRLSKQDIAAARAIAEQQMAKLVDAKGAQPARQSGEAPKPSAAMLTARNNAQRNLQMVEALEQLKALAGDMTAPPPPKPPKLVMHEPVDQRPPPPGALAPIEE